MTADDQEEDEAPLPNPRLVMALEVFQWIAEVTDELNAELGPKSMVDLRAKPLKKTKRR